MNYYFLFRFSSSSLSKLGEMIENAIVKAASSSGGTGNLFVIDDLTSLVNVGYTCQGIFDFVHHCKVISQRLVSFVYLQYCLLFWIINDNDSAKLNVTEFVYLFRAFILSQKNAYNL